MSKQRIPMDDLIKIDLPGYLEAGFLDAEEYEEETFDMNGKKVE